jgi:hypothetical protein
MEGEVKLEQNLFRDRRHHVVRKVRANREMPVQKKCCMTQTVRSEAATDERRK